MTIPQKNIDKLSTRFKTVETKADLADLLSIAKAMAYKEDVKPISVKALTYYANPALCKQRYRTFIIPKKSGGQRTINAPVDGLKRILRSLNYIVQALTRPHNAATGFVLNRSIVDNALRHTDKNYVYNIDLKDFFHSFDRNRVKLGFMYPPFDLRGDREPLAFLLACLCTHNIEEGGITRRVLPQGSPVSPTLTNLLCMKLDRRLTGLAKRFSLTYSRYADDISFSSKHNVYGKEEFLKELHRIIHDDQGFTINPKKVRLQKRGYRQEVTGLTVNQKPNVTRRYVKQIRMYLYYWEKYGFEKANAIFIKDYKTDRGATKKGTPDLANVLDGKLEFLRMVKGKEDSTYSALKSRFDLVVDADNPILEIIAIWEGKGIEKAMEKYFNKLK